MTELEQKELRIRRWEIQNFMRIEALTIQPDGKHVVLSGENAAGKSSAVDSIFGCLKGVGKGSGHEIASPIRNGADKASVILDLGDIIVERRWTEKSTSLVVTGADGSTFAKPQQLLDSLLSVAALDPVAFQALKPKEQVTELLTVVGIQPPLEKVREITGEVHPARVGESAYDYLERLAGDSGIYYTRRTDIGRVYKQKQAAVEEARKAAAALGGPVAATEKEISLSALSDQLDALRKQEDARKAALEEAEDAKRTKAEVERKIAVLTSDAADLEKKIEQFQKDLAILKERIAKGHACLVEANDDARNAAAAYQICKDAAPDIAAVRDKIANVEKINKDQARRAQATEQLDRLTGECKRTGEEHKRVEDILAKIKEVKLHLLDGVDLGVPGLSVDDGELKLSGVSFKQSSMAQRIKVGAALAMRKKPAIRILRIDEGERLDDASKKLIFDLASEQGFEVILTQVANTEGLKVEIVDK